jgi:hypothetical protein
VVDQRVGYGEAYTFPPAAEGDGKTDGQMSFVREW